MPDVRRARLYKQQSRWHWAVLRPGLFELGVEFVDLVQTGAERTSSRMLETSEI